MGESRPGDPRTAQDYIDEVPAWGDGTRPSQAPITAMQWRIWWLATAGKFFEGLVVFMTGVSLPLIGREFALSDVQSGVVGAAPLVGILIGATALGGLSDVVGRQAMFVIEMAILAAPKDLRLRTPRRVHAAHSAAGGYRMLFSRTCRRATILASVPWFLQDLGTYGIGIFTPTILAGTIGARREHAQSVSDLVFNDLHAARGAAMIDVLLIVGIVLAVLLTDRIGRIRLQVIGFADCAAGLFVASLSIGATAASKMVSIFAGFMLFSFLTNLGPNAQTYLLSGEVFPTEVRARGAGFAASFAKIGAALTAFLFPILLADIGTRGLLYGLIGTSLLGAVITWLFRIETAGISLEKIGDPHRGNGNPTQAAETVTTRAVADGVGLDRE